jgi:hypothetical protein
MDEVRQLTDAVSPGLKISRAINAVLAQRLGDTVLIDDAAGLLAVAVCHVGTGSQAGGDTCYVKFGAVRPGPGAERLFGLLIDACHGLAVGRGAPTLVAGANAGRDHAWRLVADRGFRRDLQGRGDAPSEQSRVQTPTSSTTGGSRWPEASGSSPPNVAGSLRPVFASW